FVSFLLHLPPPRPTPFPYTTLFRSRHEPRPRFPRRGRARGLQPNPRERLSTAGQHGGETGALRGVRGGVRQRRHRAPSLRGHAGDRKSTRLNSSHVAISYAVFCLKK